MWSICYASPSDVAVTIETIPYCNKHIRGWVKWNNTKLEKAWVRSCNLPELLALLEDNGNSMEIKIAWIQMEMEKRGRGQVEDLICLNFILKYSIAQRLRASIFLKTSIPFKTESIFVAMRFVIIILSSFPKLFINMKLSFLSSLSNQEDISLHHYEKIRELIRRKSIKTHVQTHRGIISTSSY